MAINDDAFRILTLPRKSMFDFVPVPDVSRAVKKLYHRKVWGGFLDGRLALTVIDTGWGGYGGDGKMLAPAIFISRRLARQQYEDVRAVEVRELKK